MSRRKARAPAGIRSFPRVSGDEPEQGAGERQVMRFSPRERG